MGRRASDISWRVAESSMMLAKYGFEKAQWTGFVPEVSARPTALLTDSAIVIMTRIEVVETVGRRGNSHKWWGCRLAFALRYLVCSRIQSHVIYVPRDWPISLSHVIESNNE
jgi:hypothetical protein